MIEVRRILCPADLSDQSRHALDHAMALARWYKASITVLQVSPPAPGPAYAPGVPGFAGLDFPPPHTEEARASTTRFVHAEDCPDLSIDVVTRAGDTATEILTHARDMHADLLVIGTHGRSGFDRLVLGFRHGEGPATSRLSGSDGAATRS